MSDVRNRAEKSSKLSPLEAGRVHRAAGEWPEAAASFLEVAAAEETKRASAKPKNPHVKRFPGASTRLDSRHRAAFCQVMAGEPEEAMMTFRSAADLDPAISEWLERFDTAILNQTVLAKSVRLWSLVDETSELPDERAALALIASPDKPYIFCESWWFAAYASLYRHGWVKAAYAAKDMAALVARQIASPPAAISPARASEVATAFADDGQFDVAKDYLRHASPSDPLATSLSKFLKLIADVDSPVLSGEAATPADMEFRKLVEGRSVAIVAPGDTGVAQGKEIDSFDLVVRTNFRSHAAIRNHAAAIGSQTDIAYYNGPFEPENREEILVNLRASPLSFLVLRFPEKQALDAYHDILPVRLSEIANPFFRMNSYAVPKIVFDLLCFSPRRIKIFNADFFLGARPHYGGYLPYDIKLVKSFLGHDVLRNFRLLKLWFDTGRVEADEVLSEILSLSESKVIDRVARRLSAAAHAPV